MCDFETKYFVDFQLCMKIKFLALLWNKKDIELQILMYILMISINLMRVSQGSALR